MKFGSFFGQWGPNATTWLLPSELFPTETRAMSHGLAAATGKVLSRCYTKWTVTVTYARSRVTTPCTDSV